MLVNRLLNSFLARFFPTDQELFDRLFRDSELKLEGLSSTSTAGFPIKNLAPIIFAVQSGEMSHEAENLVYCDFAKSHLCNAIVTKHRKKYFVALTDSLVFQIIQQTQNWVDLLDVSSDDHESFSSWLYVNAIFVCARA